MDGAIRQRAIALKVEPPRAKAMDWLSAHPPRVQPEQTAPLRDRD